MTHHHLHSSPKTCHWGFFEAKLKPVLTIASGLEGGIGRQTFAVLRSRVDHVRALRTRKLHQT